MTQREVARALGISRTLVCIIEHRALCKVSRALDLPAPVEPSWMRHYRARKGTTYHCSACGEIGHNRRACTEQERSISLDLARAEASRPQRARQAAQAASGRCLISRARRGRSCELSS